MLKKIIFSPTSLPLQCIYQNKTILDRVKAASVFSEAPKKVRQLYGPLIFPPAKEDRPYLTGCLVTSMDGRLGYDSNPGSRTLTSSNELDTSKGLTDLWILNLVRTWADGILLGSATLRDEKEFTGHIYDPDLQDFREEHPQRFARTPWNIIITRHPENLPWDHPVLSTPRIPVLMVIPENQQEALVQCPGGQFCYGVISGKEALHLLTPPAEVHQVLTWQDDRVDPRHLAVTLPADDFPDFGCLLPLLRRLGIRQLTVESPHWIWRLMAEKALDEFFVTHTGVYTGGMQIPGQNVSFTPEEPPVMELASLHLTGSSVLFSRQILHYPAAASSTGRNGLRSVKEGI